MKLFSGGFGHTKPSAEGRMITSVPTVNRLKRAKTVVSPGALAVT